MDVTDKPLPPTDQTHHLESEEAENSDQSATFQAGQVGTIAAAHFIHDSYSSFLSPLLPALQASLNINYALSGSLAVFMQLPSLLNPFIGYLADRISLRYFIILAPGVTATLMSSIGLVNSYVALAILLFGVGISIAAFHAPAPAMIGRVSGPRVGTGMSIFMASGELARAIGPLVVAAGVTWFGLAGIWRLAIIGWLTSILLYSRLRHVSARPKAVRQAPVATALPAARRVFPVLTWLMIGRVFMMAALTVYLPLFVADVLNADIWLVAGSLTVLEMAGFVGALSSGTMSDRFGRKYVLFVLLCLAPLLLLAFLYAPDWLTVPILIGLGLTAIAPQPVMLALVQDQFSDHRALANGTFLALNFVIRALGIWVVGILADQIGLSSAFLVSALLAFLAIPAVFMLPSR
ncbi:MAG: MFS transporter [Anaerolineales bacterium]|nr:MFS transporter [Anaerolineales bacterium]